MEGNSVYDWSTSVILDHTGFAVKNMRQFAYLLIALGICKMLEEKPGACKLLFDNGSILQLHEGETTVGVKPAIVVNEPGKFTIALDEHGIAWRVRDPGGYWCIDFEIGGIPFHTVRTDEPVVGRVLHRDFTRWDPTQMMEFHFEGVRYNLHKEAFEMSRIQLEDGRVLEVEWIGGAEDPGLLVKRVVNYPMATVAKP